MTNPERDEIEQMLPWYATGKLTPEERARIDNALARDKSLHHQLELVSDELLASATSNEDISAPASLSAENFMAKVERQRSFAEGGSTNWLVRLKQQFSGPASAPLRLAAAAVLVLLVLQSAALVSLFMGGTPQGFQTAGGGGEARSPGSYAVIRPSESARVSDIGKLLQESSFVIVDGPKAGGLYVVRLGPAELSAAERDAKIAGLSSRTDVIAFVAPLQ